MTSISFRWRVVAFFLALVLLAGLLIQRQGMEPNSLSAAEDQLGRELLAYESGPSDPVVVFNSWDPEYVYLDSLELDWWSVEWPPRPRWQWTGLWAAIPATDARASAGYGEGAWGRAIFGQINDPAIRSIRCHGDGGSSLEGPASATGFVHLLADVMPIPNTCSFFDDNDVAVITVPIQQSTTSDWSESRPAAFPTSEKGCSGYTSHTPHILVHS